MEHDDLWEHMALTRLQHMRGAVTTQERSIFRRSFLRALARRRDKPGISPMGNVRSAHDRPHYDGAEFNAAVWRAIDHAMHVADGRHGTPHLRTAPPAAKDLGGRHAVRALVPHSAVRVQGEHSVDAFSTVVEAVLPEVPANEAPVVCRLPVPGGSWMDVRLHDGRHLRPLASPEGWSPVSLADFARLAAGREPWVDNPVAPACPQTVTVLPLEVICPPSPAKASANPALVADARARVGALGLCVVDGMVHVATEAPQLTAMATMENGNRNDLLRTWRLGWLTGLTDMRTEGRWRGSRCALPDSYLMVAKTGNIPFHKIRGWHRPLVPDDPSPVSSGFVSAGGRHDFVTGPRPEFPRPDLLADIDPVAHVRALGLVLAEVQGICEADLAYEMYARGPEPIRPRTIPAPKNFARLREAVATVTDTPDGQEPSGEDLTAVARALDGYLDSVTRRQGMPGDRLGVLGDVLRPAFQAAEEEVARLLERSPDPDLAGLTL